MFASAKNYRALAMIVVLLLGIGITNMWAQPMAPGIRLNQLGFYPTAPKLGIVSGAAPGQLFYIVRANFKDTVFTGRLGAERQSAYSFMKTTTADFTALKDEGNYTMLVPGITKSYVFKISANAFKDAATSLLKGFYFQRASMPLEESYAGKWQRSTFHRDDTVYIHPSAATGPRPAGSIIASPGGWYDAGDYNKYVVNSGITMGTLFSAYEDFPAYFNQLTTLIPESNNKLPDLLDEAIYNLRWMLTMQDPGDGGVYNKCTNAAFDGMVMPGVTKEKRYVVQKGTAATLDFAAVTAQAARILKQFDHLLPGLSDSCLAASNKAWQWALLHPSMEYNQNAINKLFEPAITTGGYGDRSFKDEWLWAGAELFLTTRSDSFYKVVAARLSDSINLPGWPSVGMLGYYSLLRHRDQLPAGYKDAVKGMKQKVLRIAEGYIANTSTNAFSTVMGQSVRDFSWGSNSVAANQGILLVNAYLLTRERKYLDHALSNTDYLLGRNATGYCFVTGLGSKSPMNPHHRQSFADGIDAPVPGLLAGGPNPGMQDKCDYAFTQPELAYTDHDCSYASNEIAINWNAPAVYLFAAIEALKKEAGYLLK